MPFKRPNPLTTLYIPQHHLPITTRTDNTVALQPNRVHRTFMSPESAVMRKSIPIPYMNRRILRAISHNYIRTVATHNEMKKNSPTHDPLLIDPNIQYTSRMPRQNTANLSYDSHLINQVPFLILHLHGTSIHIPNTNRAITRSAHHETLPPYPLAIRRIHRIERVIGIEVPILIKLETKHAPAVSSERSKTSTSLQRPHLDRTISRTCDDTRRIKLETIHAEKTS